MISYKPQEEYDNKDDTWLNFVFKFKHKCMYRFEKTSFCHKRKMIIF